MELVIVTLLYIACVVTWFTYMSLRHKKRTRNFFQELNAGTNRLCATWERCSSCDVAQKARRAALEWVLSIKTHGHPEDLWGRVLAELEDVEDA